VQSHVGSASLFWQQTTWSVGSQLLHRMPRMMASNLVRTICLHRYTCPHLIDGKTIQHPLSLRSRYSIQVAAVPLRRSRNVLALYLPRQCTSKNILRLIVQIVKARSPELAPRSARAASVGLPCRRTVCGTRTIGSCTLRTRKSICCEWPKAGSRVKAPSSQNVGCSLSLLSCPPWATCPI
jgi:hypothetical protein